MMFKDPDSLFFWEEGCSSWWLNNFRMEGMADGGWVSGRPCDLVSHLVSQADCAVAGAPALCNIELAVCG